MTLQMKMMNTVPETALRYTGETCPSAFQLCGMQMHVFVRVCYNSAQNYLAFPDEIASAGCKP